MKVLLVNKLDSSTISEYDEQILENMYDTTNLEQVW